MRFIERRDRDRPFFLYMPFNAPHGPLMAPPGDLVKKYEGIADKKRRTYVAMVDAMDTAMGRVLACLDGEGIARNTLVLYLSDNGGPLSGGASNLQLRGAKDTVFEGGIRVPAAMYWPAGLKGGRTITQMVTVLDMLPTLAAAAGVKPGNTKPLDGRNMWPHIVRGDVRPREDLFFTTGLALGSGDPLHLAVRRGEWKLVREVKSGQAQDFLFQIEQDPNETKDLSAKHPALVKELVAAIQKWQALHPRGGKESPDRMPAGWVAPKDWARAAELEQWPDGNASSALHQY
jgi:arylsulfatase A-like enzyme